MVWAIDLLEEKEQNVCMHPKTIDRFAHVRSILPCPTSQNALLGTFCQVKNSFYFLPSTRIKTIVWLVIISATISFKMTVVKHPRLLSHKFSTKSTIPVIETVFKKKTALQNLLEVYNIIFRIQTILTNWKFGRINHCPNLTKKI